MLDDTILLENATRKMPDIRVSIIFYIFCCNVVFATGTMFMGAIPYFYYVGLYWTHNGLFISLGGWVVSYMLMTFFTTRMHVHAIIGSGIAWWLCTSAVIGFLSATLYNIAPIQFMILSWAQSLVMVMYTTHSPHNIDLRVSSGLMALATLLAWLASVYMFLIEKDWIGSILLIIMGALLGAYNLMAIHRTESRYDASWEQGVRACAEYYCFDFVEKLGV